MHELIIKLKKQISTKKKQIIYTECDERVLKAINYLHTEKILEPIIVGEKKEFLALANKINIDISQIKIIKPDERYLKQIQTKLNITSEEAKKKSLESNHFACALLSDNFFDGLISGAVYTTAQTFRPAIKILGLNPKSNLASSYFLMLAPNKEDNPLIFADCGLNIEPNSQQLAQIAKDVSESSTKYGIKPKISFLSFSTNGSATHPLQQKQKEAYELAKKIIPYPCAGEMQVDSALVPEISQKKFPGNAVAGNANILIFPDLNSANIGYKLVERLGNYQAIGPISTGFKRPVNDLSRGCSIQDIIDLSIITAAEETQK